MHEEYLGESNGRVYGGGTGGYPSSGSEQDPDPEPGHYGPQMLAPSRFGRRSGTSRQIRVVPYRCRQLEQRRRFFQVGYLSMVEGLDR